MKEIWKDIVGHEQYYEVSNLGKIRTKPRITYSGGLHRAKKYLPSIIMKPAISGFGYGNISLVSDGIRTRRYVHKLVAQHFIPNPENKPKCNHKDGNKLNNNITNLEWCTVAENNLHAVRTGLRKYPSSFGKDHHRSKAFALLDNNGNTTKVYYSQKVAADELGLSQANISRVLLGKRPHTRGFLFQFIKAGQ